LLVVIINKAKQTPLLEMW